MKTITLPLSIALLLAASTASAQYLGPSGSPVHRTVAEVVEFGKDDQYVNLTGFITSKISDDDYMFSDGTGDVRIEIDSEIFPRVPVTETTKVTIAGEIDKFPLGRLEIDVDSVTVVQE